MFNVRSGIPQLEDTFEVSLEVVVEEGEDEEDAALIINKASFVRYIDESRIISEVRDEEFAASVRARLRLGREIKTPDIDDGPEVKDEKYEALYQEEIEKAAGRFSATEIRSGGRQRVEAMPARLAACCVGWRGVKVDGREVDFTEKLCTQLLSQGEDNRFALYVMSEAQRAFVAEQSALEVAEGNSEASSDGEQSDSQTTTSEKDSTT